MKSNGECDSGSFNLIKQHRYPQMARSEGIKVDEINERHEVERRAFKSSGGVPFAF